MSVIKKSKSEIEMNEMTQLAQTFVMVCEKAMEEGKAGTYTAPVVAVALVLTAGATTTTGWV